MKEVYCEGCAHLIRPGDVINGDMITEHRCKISKIRRSDFLSRHRVIYQLAAKKNMRNNCPDKVTVVSTDIQEKKTLCGGLRKKIKDWWTSF